MKYAMAFACLGALLLSAPALADSFHSHTSPASTLSADVHHFGGGQDGNRGGDHDRLELTRLLDQEVKGIEHNPHCDPDDQNGPDGDKDDHAANNPGRGRHVGRCHNLGHPASP